MSAFYFCLAWLWAILGSFGVLWLPAEAHDVFAARCFSAGCFFLLMSNRSRRSPLEETR